MPGDWLERSLRRWKGASWWLFFGCNVNAESNEFGIEEHKLCVRGRFKKKTGILYLGEVDR